jgi:nitrogen regulatory protein PII
MLEFTKIGIKGSTIIESQGMANILSESEELNLFSSLKLLMNDGRAEKKTILTVLNSSMVDSAISAIKKFVDIDAPGSGIIFTLPVGRVVGIPS